MRKLFFVLLLALPLAAQQPCPTGQPLPKVPEIAAQNGFLRGTITVASAQVMIPFRVPTTAPTAASTYNCYPQWVRILRGSTTPAYPATTGNNIGTAMPGPTLRARVGDLVQLTLLNQIDPNVFPYSIDQGEKSFGCDQTTVYPANAGDQFPNCFHGSSTVNIHFHGSHTNPNATGDNVFLELRPSPRTQDQANAPVVNGETFKSAFDDFFKQCESMLKPADPLIEWPTKWSDLPAAYTQKQEELLKAYDASGKYQKKLWPVDARQIAQGAWAQYYIGAYPYCWRIPQYTQTVWPPVQPPVSESAAANMTKVQPRHAHGPDPANTEGAGTAEMPGKEPTRLLQMGQSPGTHWYHAHKHGSTAINVSNGMTGAFIMEGQYDDDLNAFYGANWTRTQPLMVINQLGVAPNLERGGGGTTGPGGTGQPLGQDKGPGFAVNGQMQPVVSMQPGEVQMWRIVNTSSRAGAYLSLPTGFQWRQLSQDGVQFNNANYTNPIFQNQPLLLMPGNRADMLVMAPSRTGSTPLLVQNVVDPTNDLPTAAQVTMLTIKVAGTAKPMQFIPQAPQFPPFLADIKANEVTGSKVIRFSTSKGSTGASDHFIDNKQFSGEVGQVVLLNTVEEWKVVNETYGPPIAHPFHIHINPFQVVEVFDPNETIPDPNNPGKTLPMYVTTGTSTVAGQCAIDLTDSTTWKPCGKQSADNAIWWDVFAIPSGKQFKDTSGNVIASVPGYFKMRSRFVDYAGYYVLHCHILAHEDRGMMTIVEVAPLRSPYSHH
ncbi:MAG TPA: multicopper oxidase domain-containing protein [Thermoanaerobaculia bacterium]